MVYIDNMNAPYRGMKMEKRFWSKVRKGAIDECWPWLKGTNGKRGYGRFGVNKDKVMYAHRYAFESHHNITLCESDVILHKCDNPSCCNPNHLKKGTQLDNLADMVSKGRNSCGRGEKQRSSKLTAEQVKEIKNSSESNTSFAVKFGVKQHTISNIRRGKTWRSI